MAGSLLPIREIIAKLDIPEAFVEPCGTHIAKLQLELLTAPRPSTRRKLVLVTAMTSTSSGEGKTVTSIGLAQALERIGKTAIVTLREPSLGPVFGLKGGATGGGRAEVLLREITGPVELFGACFLPVKLMHGREEIYGYRFGSAAYLTDFSEIPEESMPQLVGLDILFLDALRRKPHPSHSTLENSVRLVERLQPKRAFFTHISHDLGHEETNRSLPDHIRLAHDGLKLEFEI